MRLVIDLQGAQTPESAHRGVGRYTMGLTEGMLREAGPHEILLALNASWPESLASIRRAFASLLPPERIRAWRAPGPVAGDGTVAPWRVRAAEALRENFLASFGADVVHVSSLQEGFTNDAVTSIGTLSEGPPTGCVVYDLTPIADADTILPWPNLRDWYQEKLRHYRRARRWLAISDATRREAVNWLGLPEDAVINISAAADARFRPKAMIETERAAIGQRFGLTRPFICHVGGFEAHKNLDRLLAAFAALPVPLREQYQLALAGAVKPTDRARLEELATRLGLTPMDYSFLGHVPDDALLALLHGCTVFVYPSLREGFGLPVLEAMAAGAAVLCGDRSSLPEVVGRQDAMFDPTDVGAIAERMTAALCDAGFRDSLRAYGPERAKLFSWRSSARRALAAYESLHAEAQARQRSHHPVAVHAQALPRLAWLADWPLPPGRAEDLAGLARFYEIDLLLDRAASRQVVAAGLPILDLARFASRLSTYDRIVIERADAAVWLEEYPALLVLPDSAAAPTAGPVPLGIVRPDTVAAAERPAVLAEAIERSHADAASPVALARALARHVPADAGPTYDRQLAAAMADNLPRPGPPRLLVDVSAQALGVPGSGIARVVRRLVQELLVHPPLGFTVEPVRAIPFGGPFFRARRLAAELRGGPARNDLPEEPLELRPGDRFLGLDLHHQLSDEAGFFNRLRELGGQAHAVVYDLLPLHRPDWFPPGLGDGHRRWFETIAELDGLICISRWVMADVKAELARLGRHDGWPRLGWFHLGADLPVPAHGGPVAELAGRPSVLLVSVLYARKGQEQALDAFERLWAAGVDVNFVLAGRIGWGVDDLVARLRAHTQRGRRLFWYEGPDDALLARLYATASGVLVASEAEGFGLPLVEATHHGRPVLARDLPVFHEILGDKARYFTGLDPESLAGALRAWLAELAAGTAPRASAADLLDWAEASRRMLLAMGLHPSTDINGEEHRPEDGAAISSSRPVEAEG
jgi:glycosyltransferase involved in cell wall biosynthesis